MEKLDNFKLFVKKNPALLKYVNNKEMTWQKFYEMYDIYGEDGKVWKDYITADETKEKVKAAVTGASLGEFFNFFKDINLDSVQEGIESLQRVVGMIGDVTNKKNQTPQQEYKPRPLYKHFDD